MNVKLRFAKLSERDRALVARATALLKTGESEISSVSAGLRTRNDREYHGLCVDPASTTEGMCAEFSAIGAMVTGGDRKIDTMVAITRKGRPAYRVLPPCGRCRELARGLGNPYIIVQRPGADGESLTKVKLSELMPIDWSSRSK